MSVRRRRVKEKTREKKRKNHGLSRTKSESREKDATRDPYAFLERSRGTTPARASRRVVTPPDVSTVVVRLRSRRVSESSCLPRPPPRRARRPRPGRTRFSRRSTSGASRCASRIPGPPRCGSWPRWTRLPAYAHCSACTRPCAPGRRTDTPGSRVNQRARYVHDATLERLDDDETKEKRTDPPYV